MSALPESLPKALKAPFHDSTLSSFTLDNLKSAVSKKRTIDVISPTKKRVDFGRRPTPALILSHGLRSKSLIADFARAPPLDLPGPPTKLAAVSPPRPGKLRRSTSLLTLTEVSAADRFIPSHRNSTSGKLTQTNAPPHPNALPKTHIKAQTSKIYQHHVAEACGLDVNSRILSYRPPPPERSKPMNLFSHISLGSGSSSKLLRPSVASARAKKIPSAPERVLDAPNIVDDFYLNLVAWSLTNLIVIGLEDAVYVWNALTGSVGLLCEVPGKLVTSLRWSDDGSYISLGKDDGTVEIWDIETNSRLRTLAYSTTGRIAAHAWLQHLLTSGSKEGTINHSDVRVSNHLVGQRENTHVAEVCGVEYRGDGQQFSTGGNDNVVAIWDARNMGGEAIFKKNNHHAAVKAMAWCPFQSLLLVTGGGTSDKSIHFWNTSTGARVNLIETESQISSLNWGYTKGTGYEVVATHGYPSNSISLFHYPTLQKTGEITHAHDSRILNGCLSPDATSLATVAGDENLKFWSLFDTYKQVGNDETELANNDTKHIKKFMNIR